MNESTTIIEYVRCTEVDDQLIYQAFMDGFSDYMVKFDFTQEVFINRFFGPEGNERESSFIAISGSKPVGVILGGIKEYESIKTMRCGTLAINPDFRGAGVSQKLFELHKEEAIKEGCKQLFLEVIVGNDRAIKFYQKLGYEKIYDIVYFTNSDVSNIKTKPANSDYEIKEIAFDQFERNVRLWDYHINWQNDLEFQEKLSHNHYFGAYRNDQLAGAVSVGKNGHISFLMVDKKNRGEGVALELLQTAANRLELTKLGTSFPNNSLLEGFYKKHGFVKGNLTQYEMYLTL